MFTGEAMYLVVKTTAVALDTLRFEGDGREIVEE